MIVPDDSTAKAALQRGDIDIIEDLSNSDVPVLRQDPNVRVAYAPVMSMTALLMQTRDPLLADPRLRQALAHAIDYAQLAAAVTEGLAQPNNSIVPLVSSYHGAAQRQGWQYDPALAARLAREAGYKGQELTILTTKRYPQSTTRPSSCRPCCRRPDSTPGCRCWNGPPSWTATTPATTS